MTCYNASFDIHAGFVGGQYGAKQPMYAIFQDGGRQYRVSEGDRLDVEYRDASRGDQIEFDQVLLYSGPEKTVVGKPTVDGAVVLAEVVGQSQGPKIRVQKFRRRKNYRRVQGHRQLQTELRVREIRVPD